MAKSRAQRKAEKRRRQQAQQQRQPGSPEQASESRAQHDTQNPVSGDVAEAEAIIETGARTEDYGEHVTREPGAPAPSRADVGAPEDGGADVEAPAKPSRAERREAKKKEKEKLRRERERAAAKQEQAQKAEKRRNPVFAFFGSCWAELKKVQWPDRDTLVQASAVTLIFVVVLAAYLGGLDAIFNWIVKQIL